MGLEGIFRGGDIAQRRRRLVVALFALTVLCWWIDRLPHADSAAIHGWSDGVWTIIALLAGLKCLDAARRSTGADRIAWHLFALGCLLWTGGMVLWDWNELVLGINTPFPSLGNIGFLGMAPLFAAGLLFYRPVETTPGLARVQAGNLLIVGATLLVVVPMAFNSSVRHSSDGLLSDGPLYVVTALAYPVLYLTTLIFGLYRGAFYAWGRKRFVVVILILGMFAHAWVDLLYCRALLSHSYEAGARFDFLWVLGFALIWWAAFEQAAGVPQAPREQAGRLGLIEAVVTPLAIFVIAMTGAVTHRTLDQELILVVASLGIFLVAALAFKEWAMHRLEAGLRRAADAALAEVRHNEQRYRALVANIRDGIFLFLPDREVLAVNAAACRMLGYPEAEIVGLRYHVFFDLTDPRLAAALAERARSGYFFGELTMIRNGGERFPAEVSSSLYTGTRGELLACVVVRDISERARERAELIAAKEDAEAGSRAKSQFLAHMSHELRTPLNAIIGFSEMMTGKVHGPMGSPKYGEYADHVLDSGRHLLAIINDILDLAKVEAGKYELAVSEIGVPALLSGAVQLFTDRAARVGLRIVLETPDDLPTVIADARLLRQVLLNLLSNATKFTPAGGHIEVSADVAADGTLEIRVADSGAGIADEDIEQVLEPFGQAKAIVTRHFEGAGLGLPLAKAFMELHGGGLTISSRVGQGTIVTMSLPPTRLRQRRKRLSGHRAGPALSP